jgi:dolichyl-diphosphooligosaccharide--protein glycosyltransferase
MVTSGLIWNFLHMINMPVDIRNVCVMLAPAFSGLTAWATYLYVHFILIGRLQSTPRSES